MTTVYDVHVSGQAVDGRIAVGCVFLRDSVLSLQIQLDEALLGLSAVTFDGYDYDLVEICDQCWFADNLRTTIYADGQAIDEVTDETAWGALSTGARCDYDNDPTNVVMYGRLYNWHAVNDSRGLCPSGWHVPTDAEFTDLENFLGGDVAGGK